MMTILCDREIAERCQGDSPMISPFVPHQVREDEQGRKVVSYGLSSHGYDIRLGHQFYVTPYTGVLDPFSLLTWRSVTGDRMQIPPNAIVLGHSVETFHMPDDVIAICVGKSTYARLGLFVNITPLEAGWRGQLTIELTNSASLPVRVYAGMGIAQLLFFEGERPDVTYADRKGKYQDQTGVTLPRL